MNWVPHSRSERGRRNQRDRRRAYEEKLALVRATFFDRVRREVVALVDVPQHVKTRKGGHFNPRLARRERLFTETYPSAAMGTVLHDCRGDGLYDRLHAVKFYAAFLVK